jgi:hypothetical protein
MRESAKRAARAQVAPSPSPEAIRKSVPTDASSRQAGREIFMAYPSRGSKRHRSHRTDVPPVQITPSGRAHIRPLDASGRLCAQICTAPCFSNTSMARFSSSDPYTRTDRMMSSSGTTPSKPIIVFTL